MSEQLQLPGSLGRLVHLNLVARWDQIFGWEARLRHKHWGEDRMCPSVDNYDGLTSAELEQVLGALLATSHLPHTWISSESPYCTAEVED